jgi:hypothetical protein
MGVTPRTHWQPSRCEVLGVCQWDCPECPEKPLARGGLDRPHQGLVELPLILVARNIEAILEILPPCTQGRDREGP